MEKNLFYPSCHSQNIDIHKVQWSYFRLMQKIKGELKNMLGFGVGVFSELHDDRPVQHLGRKKELNITVVLKLKLCLYHVHYFLHKHLLEQKEKKADRKHCVSGFSDAFLLSCFQQQKHKQDQCCGTFNTGDRKTSTEWEKKKKNH